MILKSRSRFKILKIIRYKIKSWTDQIRFKVQTPRSSKVLVWLVRGNREAQIIGHGRVRHSVAQFQTDWQEPTIIIRTSLCKNQREFISSAISSQTYLPSSAISIFSDDLTVTASEPPDTNSPAKASHPNPTTPLNLQWGSSKWGFSSSEFPSCLISCIIIWNGSCWVLDATGA